MMHPMTTSLEKLSGSPCSAGCDLPSGPPGFLSAYPGYRSTALLDQLRAAEYSYLDAGGHVYLDYTGAGLPAQAQLAEHAERVRGRCFGNPHSENPTSAASTELIERARGAVLAHFNAPPQEYAAIFTANATGACRLIGEAYPFGPRTRLVLTQDNHNSVNGIREFARSRGALTRYVPFMSAAGGFMTPSLGAAHAELEQRYRRLLRLYPHEFRTKCADEMLGVLMASAGKTSTHSSNVRGLPGRRVRRTGPG
jgi:Aminotransferase class-V